ncbi:unnamed protein product [Sphenostylis stenocarpa]|uniref:RADIALIS n=1 Tax=Sphenostylis stenocarpa TaxID=92480 RepID=A0AA86W0F0_9FABA|nr:unnamed protein product [Sphenostylis stenocarpa]
MKWSRERIYRTRLMGWTREENRRFEDALAVHGPDDPNRWQHVANAVGGKSVEEVKMHYEILKEDVIRIERDQIPLPRYRGAGINGRHIDNEQRRMRNLTLR